MSFPCYPAYKPSGVEWLGEVPEHWDVTKLGRICIFESGKAHEPFIDEDGDFICVNSRFISTECQTAKNCRENHSPAFCNDVLAVKRQCVISHAVTKGLNPDVPMKDSGVEWLGEVPEHWGVMQLNKLINKITNGYVGPTRDILVDEGVRYLQSLHIKGNRIIFDTPYHVSKEWNLSKEKSILCAGDVLIVQTGDIGQSAVVTDEFEGCNCHALIVVSPRQDPLSGEWLSWILNSTFGRETLLFIQTGALHPHLNCGNVKHIQIPVQPKDEQETICRLIQVKNEEFDCLISASSSSINLMLERRSALISAAVTGQIDVRGMVPEAEAA